MSVVSSLADVLPSEALGGGAPAGGGSPFDATAEAVVRPRSTEEVAATLTWASEHGMGVLPIASGQRVRRPGLDRPFLVLRTERLGGVERYEPADLTLTARAGTPMIDLQQELERAGQWLPFDPPDIEERTLGGLVATGESGAVWMGFGELRNHVLGATVVTGDGRTLALGGRVVKNVAGFDLLKAVVGSRGRLGVITSVCMRVFPRPPEDLVLVLTGQSLGELAGVALSVGTAPVLPVSSVIVSPLRSLGAPAALLLRLHGSGATVESDRRTLERHCGVAFEPATEAQRLLREARGIGTQGSPILDVTALPSFLGAVLGAIVECTGNAELFVDGYSGRVRALVPEVEAQSLMRLRERVASLGGSMTIGPGGRDGPEGVPIEERGASQRAVGELVQGIERVFDPAGVFWPCRP